MPDVLFTYFTDTWADAERRGFCFTLDRYIQCAAEDTRVGRLMVANPYRSAPIDLLRRVQGRRSPPLPAGSGTVGAVQPLRLRHRGPASPDGLRRAYESYDAVLEREARDKGLSRPVVITANPFVAAWCPLTWAGPVTYLGYDDWSALDACRRLWPAIRAAYSRIGSSGRKVAAVTQPIVDAIGPSGEAIVIPNGVEPSEWQPPYSTPRWSETLKRPIALYLGLIESRLDLGVVEAVASRPSIGSVVFVGIVTDPIVGQSLSGIPGVHLQAGVGRQEVSGVVRAADVCIMPHRDTPLTRAMSPLKLYEYMAGGRPVAATDLGTADELVGGRIVMAEPGDAQGFADSVEAALRIGPASEPEREEFVRSHSWHARFETLWSFVSDRRV